MELSAINNQFLIYIYVEVPQAKSVNPSGTEADILRKNLVSTLEAKVFYTLYFFQMMENASSSCRH